MDEPTPSFIPKAFLENRERLARLAVRRLNPQLAYVLSVDDILQETFIAAQKRRLFFESRPDVPVYFKFRVILLQVLTDAERRHLGTRKHDLGKEVHLDDLPCGEVFPRGGLFRHVADQPPSPHDAQLLKELLPYYESLVDDAQMPDTGRSAVYGTFYACVCGGIFATLTTWTL